MIPKPQKIPTTAMFLINIDENIPKKILTTTIQEHIKKSFNMIKLASS